MCIVFIGIIIAVFISVAYFLFVRVLTFVVIVVTTIWGHLTFPTHLHVQKNSFYACTVLNNASTVLVYLSRRPLHIILLYSHTPYCTIGIIM